MNAVSPCVPTSPVNGSTRYPTLPAPLGQQGRLNLLQRDAARRKVSTILVFEGWDAAGKGGAIRRITSALDLRAC
jgi:polyphosphate kinase 2 (PPK2 family)